VLEFRVLKARGVESWVKNLTVYQPFLLSGLFFFFLGMSFVTSFMLFFAGEKHSEFLSSLPSFFLSLSRLPLSSSWFQESEKET
jgi:hypothetical protein